jgi:hypothetical protein
VVRTDGEHTSESFLSIGLYHCTIITVAAEPPTCRLKKKTRPSLRLLHTGQIRVCATRLQLNKVRPRHNPFQSCSKVHVLVKILLFHSLQSFPAWQCHHLKTLIHPRTIRVDLTTIEMEHRLELVLHYNRMFMGRQYSRSVITCSYEQEGKGLFHEKAIKNLRKG